MHSGEYVVSRQFPHSRDFDVSPASKHFLYSMNFVLQILDAVKKCDSHGAPNDLLDV